MTEDIDWTALGKKKEEPKKPKVEKLKKIAEKKFECAHCGKKYSSSSALERHVREFHEAPKPEYDDLKAIIEELQKDYILLEEQLKKKTQVQIPPLKKIQKRIIARRELLKNEILAKYPDYDFDKPYPMNQYGVELDVDKKIFEYEELSRLLNRFHKESGNMQRLIDFVNKFVLKKPTKK